MIRTIVFITAGLLLAMPVAATATMELTFENFDDQDVYNNFSGDSGLHQKFPAIISQSFDTVNRRGSTGACLRLDYSVPSGGFGGVWHSVIGRHDYLGQTLNFNDLYGELKNSTGNGSTVENVQVSIISFWVNAPFSSNNPMTSSDPFGNLSLFIYITSEGVCNFSPHMCNILAHI